MTELDEKIFTSLEVSLHIVPDAESLHTLGTATVLGIICHYHISIDVRFQSLSPSTLGIFV